MEYNLCYDIDYKCVFDVDRVVFWATRIKHVSHRKHRVRLLYPALAVSDSWCPGSGIVLRRVNNMTDRRQPWEQLSSCERNMSSGAWLSNSTTGGIVVHVCDRYPGEARPGDYIVTLAYCACVVWRQCHAKCN